MDFKNVNYQWVREHREQLSKNERLLISALKCHENFLIFGDREEMVVDIARLFDIEVIRVYINSLVDIVGEKRISCENDSAYFYNHIDWAEQILQHPEKFYVVLFNIDNADADLINKLGSFIKNKRVGDGMCELENVFVGLIATNINKEVPQYIKKLIINIIKE